MLQRFFLANARQTKPTRVRLVQWAMPFRQMLPFTSATSARSASRGGISCRFTKLTSVQLYKRTDVVNIRQQASRSQHHRPVPTTAATTITTTQMTIAVAVKAMRSSGMMRNCDWQSRAKFRLLWRPQAKNGPQKRWLSCLICCLGLSPMVSASCRQGQHLWEV